MFPTCDCPISRQWFLWWFPRGRVSASLCISPEGCSRSPAAGSPTLEKHLFDIFFLHYFLLFSSWNEREMVTVFASGKMGNHIWEKNIGCWTPNSVGLRVLTFVVVVATQQADTLTLIKNSLLGSFHCRIVTEHISKGPGHKSCEKHKLMLNWTANFSFKQ